MFGVSSIQSLSDGSQPAADPGLFLLEEIKRYRPGVVGLEQAGLFTPEPISLALELQAVLFGAEVKFGQVVAQHVDHRLSNLGRQ